MPVVAVLLLSATLLLQAQGLQCVSAPGDMRSFWTLDSSLVDEVAGVEGAGSCTFEVGKVGQGICCTGQQDVKMARMPYLSNLNKQVTIEFWIKLSTNNPLFSGAACCQGIVSLQRFNIEISMGGINVAINAGEGHTADSNNGVGAMLVPELWQHVAATYDGFALRLYINGALWGTPHSFTNPIAPLTTNAYTTFGSSEGMDTACGICQGRFFQGCLDEVAVYNRPLTAAEIHAIFEAGAAGKCTVARTTTTSAPVAVTTPASGSSPGGNAGAGDTTDSLSKVEVVASAVGAVALAIVALAGIVKCRQRNKNRATAPAPAVDNSTHHMHFDI